MPKGLSNWSYRDVIDFLKSRNFTFYKPKGGSHEAWISDSYPELTLKTMIRQSGIDQKEWRNWAGGKKF